MLLSFNVSQSGHSDSLALPFRALKQIEDSVLWSSLLFTIYLFEEIAKNPTSVINVLFTKCTKITRIIDY